MPITSLLHSPRRWPLTLLLGLTLLGSACVRSPNATLAEASAEAGAACPVPSATVAQEDEPAYGANALNGDHFNFAGDLLADTTDISAAAAEADMSKMLGSADDDEDDESESFTVADDADHILQKAMTQLGKRYRPGGIRPETGFDCSGFTRWVYASMGVDLPRTSRDQFMEGKKISKNQLKPGDLVFFKRTKKRISHVGIYLDDGKFIHSSSRGDTVKISDIDSPAWSKKWAGARRVID